MNQFSKSLIVTDILGSAVWTDGLGGNDDCGQMSAWYMMSSFGFYPMPPASDRYDTLPIAKLPMEEK